MEENKTPEKKSQETSQENQPSRWERVGRKVGSVKRGIKKALNSSGISVRKGVRSAGRGAKRVVSSPSTRNLVAIAVISGGLGYFVSDFSSVNDSKNNHRSAYGTGRSFGVKSDASKEESKAKIDSLRGAYRAKLDSVNNVLAGLQRNLNHVESALRRRTGERDKMRSALTIAIAERDSNQKKADRLEEVVKAQLLGSPDSVRVINSIVSGTGMVLTGKEARKYDPRAETGEIYVFETKNGRPVGFGYRLSRGRD